MFSIEAVSYRDPEAPKAFVRSLRETGFAVLTDHPIAAERVDQAYALWGEAFASRQINDYARHQDNPEGYYPFRSENAKGSPTKDLKEFFQIYPRTAMPPQVEPITRGLYDDLLAIGRTLLSWLQEETPDAVKARFSEPLPAMLDGSFQSMLRILHYPALDATLPEPGAARAAAHEDINLITLLVAGSAPGLEARDVDGNWHAVPCDRGMIAVNAGDMLEVASGGYYPSTTHRVVNPDEGEGGERFSMPMFIHPRPEVALSAQKTAGAFLDERLREIGLA